MPALIALSLAIEALFVIHVIRTGRDPRWTFIILVFPMVGCTAYFFMEMYPDIRRSRTARQAVNKIAKSIDPARDIRRHSYNLEVSNNIDNKLKLAEEYIETGHYAQAVALYESAREGIFQDDPSVLLGLARASFLNNDFAKTKNTLDYLKSNNPDFKSNDGHLLYARTLEGMNDIKGALHEYEALASYYPGPEAKCRYAQLLQKQGNETLAQALFSEVLKTAKFSPPSYRKLHKQWIELAKVET